MEKKRKIYIVLTYSGTLLSKIVKFYTRREFSHVSISLDENLDEMFSFGRVNPYIPFIGGFVQESPYYGTFRRFSKTKTRIYSLEVTNSDYKKMKEVIYHFQNNKSSYKFNVIGLFAVALHLKIKKEKSFYCAEFVKYVLDNSELDVSLPEIIKPDDFSSICGLEEVYYGRLNQYNL